MRKWAYNDLDGSTKIYTEEEILDMYWDHWYNLMVKKYGYGHELITKENCIDDWTVVNWAWIYTG